MRCMFLAALAWAFSFGLALAGPLQTAVRDGNIGEVRSLIATGAIVNERSRLLGWPLHQAALNDHVEIGKLLIAAGADVHVMHRVFGSPFHAAAQKGSVGVASLLLKNGADPNSGLGDPASFGDGSTPLHLAAGNGHSAMVELLVVHGADVAATTTSDDLIWVDHNAVHTAGQAGHFDIVALLESYRERGAPNQLVSSLSAAAVDPDANRAAWELTPGVARCAGCHTFNDPERNGPHLVGIVGRPKASVSGFAYSEALKRLGGVWTLPELDAFIAGAAAYLPGTKMEVWGVEDPEERAKIIAHLSTL